MEPVPGAMLGQYQLLERVGRGGMAEVWRAFQPSLARHVAVKLLPSFLADDPAYRERFRREARAVSQLRHQNILTIIDYGEQDGTAYMVSEFVPGGTLADQLGRPLPLDYVISLARPIGQALDYAHARNLVHRDVKPSNVLLQPDGTPILADFGVAAMLSGVSERLTGPGVSVGTPAYMSPEQVAGAPATPRADLYSLGVVLYEMLTGRTPFQAETPAAVALAHLHKPLPPPRSVNPALPVAVEAVLLKTLAKAPDARYGSARELFAALEAAAAAPTPLAAPAPPPADERPTARMEPVGAGPRASGAPPRGRGRVLGSLAFGLLALAVGVGGLWVASGGGQVAEPARPTAAPTAVVTREAPPAAPTAPAAPTSPALAPGGPTALPAAGPTVALPAAPAGQPTAAPSPAGPAGPAVAGPSPSPATPGRVVAPLRELVGHTDAVWALSFSPDGKRLASGSHREPRAVVWDVASGSAAQRFDGHNGAVVGLAWDPAVWPDLVASGGHDGTVRLWDARNGKETSEPLGGHGGRVWAVAWARAGVYLASAADDGARVWAPGSGKPAEALPSQHGAAYALAWVPVADGERNLAVGYADGTVVLWDALAKRARPPLGSHRGEARSLAWTPDGRFLASGGADGVLHLWRAQTSTTARAPAHRGTVWAVAWSRDGRLLASGGEDGVVRLWTENGERLVPAGAITDPRGPVFGLAWADRYVLAIGRQDGKVQLVTVR